MDSELKPLKGTFEWNLGNTRDWTWWPLCFHSPCPLCVIPSWLTVFNLGVASESLSSRQVCVTGHRTCLHACTLHTHACTYTHKRRSYLTTTEGGVQQVWGTGKMAGRRENRGLQKNSHCSVTPASSLPYESTQPGSYWKKLWNCEPRKIPCWCVFEQDGAWISGKAAILKMISFQDKADDSDFSINIRMLLTPLSWFPR